MKIYDLIRVKKKKKKKRFASVNIFKKTCLSINPFYVSVMEKRKASKVIKRRNKER